MTSSTNKDFLPSLTFEDFEWLWNSSTDEIENPLEDFFYPSSHSSTTSSEADFKDFKDLRNKLSPNSPAPSIMLSDQDPDISFVLMNHRSIHQEQYFSENEPRCPPVSYWKELVPIRHEPEHTPKATSDATNYSTRRLNHHRKDRQQENCQYCKYMPYSHHMPANQKQHICNAIQPAKYCSYCKKASSHGHYLYTEDGRVSCPLLRKIVCPYCGATGDNAHIGRRCPLPAGKIVHSQDVDQCF